MDKENHWFPIAYNGYGYNAVRLAASLLAMPAMRLAGAGWREREPGESRECIFVRTC
jgi:hypothetical protein